MATNFKLEAGLIKYLTQHPNLAQSLDIGIFTHPTLRQFFGRIVAGDAPEIIYNDAPDYVEKIRELPDIENVDAVLDRLNKDAYKRHIAELDLAGFDPDMVEKTLSALKRRFGYKADRNHIKDVVARYKAQIEAELATPFENRILPTPFDSYNQRMYGLYAGKHVTLAARPGMGKSTLLAQFREIALKTNRTVITFALEMGERHMLERMIAARMGVELKEIMSLKILDDPQRHAQFYDLLARYEDVQNWSLYGADYRDWRLMNAVLENHLANDDVAFVEVDFLQLVYGGQGENRNQQLGNVVQRLQEMCVDHWFVLLSASQLSRKCEERQDKRPTLGDLRDSGEIEQAIDVGFGVYRHEIYNPGELVGQTELIGLKNRQGSIFNLTLQFMSDRLKFVDTTNQNSTSVLF